MYSKPPKVDVLLESLYICVKGREGRKEETEKSSAPRRTTNSTHTHHLSKLKVQIPSLPAAEQSPGETEDQERFSHERGETQEPGMFHHFITRERDTDRYQPQNYIPATQTAAQIHMNDSLLCQSLSSPPPPPVSILTSYLH